jgi:integrase
MMDHLGKTMPLSKLRSQDIRDLCFRPDISVATQRSYFTHYRVFFKWLFDNKYIAEDLVKGIKPPKQIDRLVDKVIDEQGLKRLFETFDAHIAKNVAAGFIVKDIQKMLWFKPVISTFFYAGLRSKELIHLKWKDIDADFRFIRVVNSKDVTTKSGKMRSIPIRKPLIPYLKEWKAMCDASPDNYVFTNPKALVKGQKMDPIKITHTFKRFARMANLPKDCNVHGLRHSFGTEILKKGIPINEVALMMGHSSIEVTKIYQHLTPDDLYESVRNIDR